MKNKLPILGVIMLFMIACRAWLNDSPYEIPAVASINLISLLIVFLAIMGGMRDMVTKNIEQTGVPEDIIQRETNKAYKYVRCLYVPLFVFAFIYYRCWICELGNDIISIVAIFISLLEEIAVIAVNFYMEKILWKKS